MKLPNARAALIAHCIIALGGEATHMQIRRAASAYMDEHPDFDPQARMATQIQLRRAVKQTSVIHQPESRGPYLLRRSELSEEEYERLASTDHRTWPIQRFITQKIVLSS